MKTFSMKLIRYIFLYTILLVSAAVQAQDTLSINPHALDTLSNTAYEIDSGGPANTPSFNVMIYNHTGRTVIDSVSLGYTINSGGLLNAYNTNNYNGGGIECVTHTVQVGPYDSAALGVIFHFSGPEFVIGSSTVVIWPVFTHPNTVVLDSATGHVTVVATTTGIPDVGEDHKKVYISGSRLFIKDPENAFGELRIYNAIGECIATQKLSGSAEIPMSPYATGMYVVETISKEGKRTTCKVFNE